jgi:hypothetical protein
MHNELGKFAQLGNERANLEKLNPVYMITPEYEHIMFVLRVKPLCQLYSIYIY